MSGNIPFGTSLPPSLEAKLGANMMSRREKVEQQQLIVCPPVPPQLLEHLKIMFEKPDRDAKPTNPMLSQLLMIQYGVNKVINYLQDHYDNQSKAERERRGV